MADATNKIAFHDAEGRTVTILGLASGPERYFEITFDTDSAIIPQSLFATVRKDGARAELTDLGINVTDNRTWSQICTAVNKITEYVPQKLIKASGWNDNHFVFPDGKIVSPRGQPRGKVIFRPEHTTKRCRGFVRNWQTAVALPLTGQTIPMIAVMAAFASPLLRLVDIGGNFGLEIWGGPGTGKTTCQKIAASVIGSPADHLDFNVTMAGLENEMPRFNDLLMVIDEANLAAKGMQFLEDLSYKMANGRQKKTAFNRNSAVYRFVFLTSANQPFSKTIDRNAITDAALQRLLPIQIPSDSEFGVFDFLPANITSSKELATAIEGAIAKNYGTPMKKFIKHLVRAKADNPDIKRRILDFVTQFEERAGVLDTVRGGSRASFAFGLMRAAGELAKEANILPPSWDCQAAALSCYRNYLHQLSALVPLEAVLTEILERPETLRVTAGSLPSLNDQQLAKAGAFVKVGCKGLEIMVTVTTMDRHMPQWHAHLVQPDFEKFYVRDRDHLCKKRNVRKGRSDRLLCFKLPADHKIAIKFGGNSI
ncbi:hypothetical protein M2336_000305 [Sphingobium sp. B1D7B]|uniref:DUF927 domain-containing protein n=1 Tax=unclassified Sphingobium TaxID=2611147 RepID=UPI0022246EAE|nr:MULTISPECIES: DUF927 domain-containing protein [unclassified Sphingobium]MCW2391920.1 hypothetical protein [Sphingobium sp. B11D3A]MCW2403676.1 hypothetical protein [Sphingobium sp. B1D7B]